MAKFTAQAGIDPLLRVDLDPGDDLLRLQCYTKKLKHFQTLLKLQPIKTEI